jgi:hypothetical protein
VTNQFTKRLVKKAAWHEAGHVVHTLVCIDRATQFNLGHAPFKAVWVKRTADEPAPNAIVIEFNGRGAVLGNGQIWCCAETHITNYVAGIAGERMLTRKKVGKVQFADWLSGAGSDLSAASEIVKEDFPGIDADKFINRCVEAAWAVLQFRRKAVEAIANALIEKGYLSYYECKKTYEENQ